LIEKGKEKEVRGRERRGGKKILSSFRILWGKGKVKIKKEQEDHTILPQPYLTGKKKGGRGVGTSPEQGKGGEGKRKKEKPPCHSLILLNVGREGEVPLRNEKKRE